MHNFSKTYEVFWVLRYFLLEFPPCDRKFNENKLFNETLSTQEVKITEWQETEYKTQDFLSKAVVDSKTFNYLFY